MTDNTDLMEIGEVEDLQAGQILDTSISKEMQKAYLDYAMSVIVSRALPDIRDGLKPVHRRIVYAASQMNLTADAIYSKSAKLVGEVIGKYHPHGDTSIYDALVRMAQDFSLRYPLIDGQGNFGNIDGDPAAAMRYTECRLARISDYLLSDIDKDTVLFEDNYSAEYKEPTVLPAIIPNLLMNGSAGIAVGMATNIPPHNLNELADALTLILEKGEVTESEKEIIKIRAYDLIETDAQVTRWEVSNHISLEELAGIIKGPDFPTGCTIYDKSETLRYFATGRGQIIQRAEAKIEELKGGKFCIVISEIPYQVNKTTLIKKIADLVNEKKVREISDIRDESSRGKMKIVVELKRDSNPKKVLNYLYKYSQLQNAFNANMLALVNGKPQTLGIKAFLDEFIKHRRDVIINRSLHLLKKAREREHILEGLKKALDFIDEVIAIIKKSKDSDEAKTNLIKRFELTEIQAQAILDMQLRRLAALEREKIENELAEIQKTITNLLQILANPSESIKIIKNELIDIKAKFGDARRTKVIKGKIGELSEEDLIANQETLIAITISGYIKRVSPDTYKTQSRGGKGVVGMKTKEEDEVALMRLADTHDKVLFMTNQGRVYEKHVWDIPESSRTSKGTAIVNVIEMSSNEKVQEIITIKKDFEGKRENLYILTASKFGQIKKTALSEFENIRRTGIIGMGMKEGDEVVRSMLTSGQNEVILVTTKGKSVRFKEEDVRPMGRSASGVRGIKLKSEDAVVSMEILSKENETEKLLTIMSHGYGKKTKISQYTLQNRGGSGIKAANITAKTGDIVAVKIINSESKDIILTSENGQIIRIPAESIPTLSRDTQGVILMRLKGNDKVSAVSAFGKGDESGELD